MLQRILTIDKKVKVAGIIILLFSSRVLPGQERVIESGDNWSYYDQGDDPGAGWTELSFEDEHWRVGRSPLGYDIDEVTTTIDYGDDEDAKYPVSYFRKEVVIDDSEAFLGFRLTCKRDDGMVVYVNNSEVWRSNMKDGLVTNGTFAIDRINREKETEEHIRYINPSYFRTGPNIIAVSVHQGSLNSSDLFFDFTLTGLDDAKVLQRLIEEENNDHTFFTKEILYLNKSHEYDQEVLKNEYLERAIFSHRIVLLGFAVLLLLGLYLVYKYYQKQLIERQHFLNEKQQLMKLLKAKDNEMVKNSLLNMRNSNFVREIKYDLRQMNNSGTVSKRDIDKLVNKIDLQSQDEEDWDNMKYHFDSVYSGFFQRLSEQFPSLSQLEIRHCGFMKLQLDTKEISQILRIEPKSVQASRYRIKKKLQLGEEVDLRDFINHY